MNAEYYRVINENKGMIYKIAYDFCGHSHIEDLFQVGCIGVIKAYKRYKKEFNTAFSTYAYHDILGEMANYLKNDRLVKLNGNNAKIYKLYKKARDFLISSKGFEPSLSDIAAFMGISELDLYNAICNNYPTESIDKEVAEDLLLQDVIGNDERELVESSIDLKQELDKLTEKERKIIKYRYYEDYTQCETADMMGMSQVQVSRAENKILSRMKKEMVA